MSSKLLKVVSLFRSISLLLFIYTCTNSSLPEEVISYYDSLYFGRIQFLTIIGLHMTIIVTICKFLSEKLAFFNYLFELLFPITFLAESTITLGFWALYFTNEDFVRHKIPGSDHETGIILEISQHLLPFVLLIVEWMCHKESWHVKKPEKTPKNKNFKEEIPKKKSIYTSLIVSKLILFPLYYAFAYFVYYLNQRWPYPILENISHLERLKIFISYAMLGTVPTWMFFAIADPIKRKYL